ncbi:hypothetical protein Sgly_1219 [Syntrophobotulus glycolicus DSM 8271]|uniref:Uncharacterized protein n=1 Tax=Syntrophobotulus glycolicus (strain DSM 8271 / FlGlyR) TaxID=645991 RepID=F0SUP3_SYNGF|nr:hypothetical protein [Syntrophobotulus glycolicus]ADY55536.1 hypothetical protein Sgly_1219 [Syntrophobotulus glycolicus DSM 8271]
MGAAPLKQEKSKEQLFSELAVLQKDMEKNLAVQEQFIKRFQGLLQAEAEPLTLLNLLPYPAALFKRGGILHRVNDALMESTDLREGDIPDGNINFLSRVTNENFAILEAAEGVFYGKTALLSRLSHPLELFCKNWNYRARNNYGSALFFPIPDGDGNIRYGAVMLMK